MPITQSRMIALMSAGLDYQQALRLLLSQISNADRAVRDHGADPAEQFSLLTANSEAVLLIDPVQTGATLAVEQKHFSVSTIQTNENMRMKMAGRRASQGHLLRKDRQEPMPKLMTHALYNMAEPRTTAPARMTPRPIQHPPSAAGTIERTIAQVAAQLEAEEQELGGLPDTSVLSLSGLGSGLDPETMAQLEAEAEAALASLPEALPDTSTETPPKASGGE